MLSSRGGWIWVTGRANLRRSYADIAFSEHVVTSGIVNIRIVGEKASESSNYAEILRDVLAFIIRGNPISDAGWWNASVGELRKHTIEKKESFENGEAYT